MAFQDFYYVFEVAVGRERLRSARKEPSELEREWLDLHLALLLQGSTEFS